MCEARIWTIKIKRHSWNISERTVAANGLGLEQGGCERLEAARS